MTIAYTKGWRSIPEQLEKLKRGGLIIADEAEAASFLRHLNDYRFSGYGLAFEQSRHVFVPGTTFEQLRDAYEFDRALRDLVYESMEVGLERVFKQLESLGQGERLTHVIVEARGRREDNELELAFRRIADGQNYHRHALPLEMKLVPKASNSVGLQLTDLMARPIGIHHIRPQQANRAYEIIQTKFRRGPSGQINGWGIKVIP